MEYMIYVRGVFIILLLISVFVHLTLSILQLKPTLNQPRPGCQSPVLRKEWSAATDAERSSYIDAVLCLPTKPSRIGLVNSTLYDDFAYLHSLLEPDVHGVAMFLPWHRYFIHIYEEALHSCGYTGVAMYWDWVADSAAPSKAKVWSPVNGFGGNGSSTNPSDPDSYCVRDGPFQNLRPYYKENNTRPHCLERDFMNAYPEANLQEMLGYAYTPAIITAVMASTNYSTFYGKLGGGPHESVHAGISQSTNGDMGLLTAPNGNPSANVGFQCTGLTYDLDPIFFLHHTQLDRLWWLWQQASPSSRSNDYAGKTSNGSPALLTDFMPMLKMAPDRQVRDFMSTETIDLCYRY